MNDFFRTRMGMTFFEGTMPRIANELKRLNDNLEKMNADKERANGVSREYVLDQLAGMKFPEQGQAYDFIKKMLLRLLKPVRLSRERGNI